MKRAPAQVLGPSVIPLVVQGCEISDFEFLYLQVGDKAAYASEKNEIVLRNMGVCISVVLPVCFPRPAAPVCPGHWLGMHIPEPCPRPAESGSWAGLSWPLGGAGSGLRITALTIACKCSGSYLNSPLSSDSVTGVLKSQCLPSSLEALFVGSGARICISNQLPGANPCFVIH